MTAAPLRFLNAIFWPFTIWLSLSRFEEHSADDYVERTSPIVAFAVAFWVCAISLAVLWYMINPGSFRTVTFEGVEQSVRLVQRWPNLMFSLLSVFTPAIYAIGFWMVSARDERYPR